MIKLLTLDEVNFCLSLVGYPKDLIPSRKERLDRIKSLGCGLGRQAKEKT